jgi:hypothetical protein
MPDTVSLRDQTAILSQPSFVPKLYRNQFYDLPRLGRAPTWIAAGNSTASFRGGLPFNISPRPPIPEHYLEMEGHQ